MIEDVLDRYSRHLEFLGEDLLDVCQVGAFGSQVLHLAAFVNRCDDIEDILGAGADKNAVGDLGLTPLHYAVLGHSLDAVQLLMSKGADLRMENEYGETPAQMALLMGHADMARLLGGGNSLVFADDGHSVARERWLEFKAIQVANLGDE